MTKTKSSWEVGASEWPYPIRYGVENEVSADVLVLGGGIAGCWAAISAARKGLKVALVDKGAVIRSGSGGAGCDHWLFSTGNPACKVSAEELTGALIENHNGYKCGITAYINCRESYNTLLELEKMGVKVRDTEDEFKGAEFRDEKTKLLFAYEYENKYNIRIWGSMIKPALYNECKRLGVELYERVMVTSLLTAGGKQGAKVVGATGVNTRTGEFYAFQGKATVLCLASPERVWIFSTELTGLYSFQPPQCSGDGHAMAWKAGAEFAAMESSAEGFTAFSYPPYGTGNPRNTWLPCTMVDANGKEIPWVDRDGRILKTVSERCRPAPGQKFFLAGGGAVPRRHIGISQPGVYEYRGPDLIPDLAQRIAKGEFALPLYADLPSMPEHERRVIFGLMVGQEGKTKVGIYENYTRAGFDPNKDLLQAYKNWGFGVGPPQWRTLQFSVGGGVVVDWGLKTNLDGLYAAGQQVFGGLGHSLAATTGEYAGRKAADYALKAGEPVLHRKQVEDEKARIYAPVNRKNGIEWKELHAGVSRIMQDYCGEPKNEELLKIGLKWFDELKEGEASTVYARNPHELVRALEVLNILAVGEMIMHASLSRKASNSIMNFTRSDYPEMAPPEWHKWITTRLENEEVKIGELLIDYWGPLKENYEAHCGLRGE